MVSGIFSQFGTVKEECMENSIQGMQNVHTLVRSFIIELDQSVAKEDLPYTSTLNFGREHLSFMLLFRAGGLNAWDVRLGT